MSGDRGDRTAPPGDAAPPPNPGAARARAALEQARADARERGEAAVPARRRPAGAAKGRRARLEDPMALRASIDDLLTARGWQGPAAMGGVFGRWTQIVGRDLAEHTEPYSFADGELVVLADSPAWATQVRLLAATLVRRLNEELGTGTVRRVQVRGPAGERRPRRAGAQGGDSRTSAPPSPRRPRRDPRG